MAASHWEGAHHPERTLSVSWEGGGDGGEGGGDGGEGGAMGDDEGGEGGAMGDDEGSDGGGEGQALLPLLYCCFTPLQTVVIQLGWELVIPLWM